jgi:hypothetical protein
MPELNFDDLREAVENDTYLPEFEEVKRRARRHKRWRILINAARVLGVLIVAAPGFAIGDVVFTHIYNPAKQATHTTRGGDGGGTSVDGVTPTLTPVTRSVVAVDGTDLAHTYALDDVCAGRSCDLQLTQVNPSAVDALAERVGLLRTSPSDTITNPQIVVVNETTVIVSANVNSSPRQYLTLSVNPEPGRVLSTPRPVQTTAQGPIRVVNSDSGPALPIDSQPPVSEPVLANDVGGWWVCGTTPAGELAVSVSHDDGRVWTTHRTGLLPDASTPGSTAGAALATADGTHVYLMMRSRGGIALIYSGDGGMTWDPIATSKTWPNATTYSLVITPDGSLLASFTAAPKTAGTAGSTTYLISKDQGATFLPPTGPLMASGPIVAVGNGFVSLGTSPAISPDGVNWQAAYVPYVTTSGN